LNNETNKQKQKKMSTHKIIQSVDQIQNGCYLLNTFTGKNFSGHISPVSHIAEDVFIVTDGDEYEVTFTTGDRKTYEADELRSAIEDWAQGSEGFTKWQLITK
jgi:hypothetical protein